MAFYRTGEVNCGHCNEPTGVAADDWLGPIHHEGHSYITSVAPCVRCQVHTDGTLDRCPDDCPDCAENDRFES
ncbi:hypothetical protein ACFY1P_33900 [Streptomyces sp. NPDC001407]|uniref:hypothetical protein n=1 Tax=Streptomyces sp. NPDC001407 TaxID=3364573 RepID=UPI0036CBAF75